MDAKFAILEYAANECDFISGKLLTKSKWLRDRHIRKQLPYKAMEVNVLGVSGYKVTLPITAPVAEENKSLKNDVYEGVLHILRQSGVSAIKAANGMKYDYDYIIPASSGYFALPFILPVFLKKCAKMLEKDISGAEALVIDGISDLTLDILLIIANEINRITVITDDIEFFQNVADRFYRDSGLNINVTASINDYGVKNADITLNASNMPDNLTNRFKSGSIYLDMAGSPKKTSDISARRADMVVADGAELKIHGHYVDNVMLETVLLSTHKSFERYVFGRYDDNDFYGILDYITSLNCGITTLLRGGKPIKG